MKNKWTIIVSLAALVLVPVLPAGAAELAGSVTGSYQYRSAPGKAGFSSPDDQDLDLWGRADVTSLLAGKAEGHLTFRAFKDIDGTLPGDALYQIGDTFSGRDDLRLYEGFLTFRMPGRPVSLSLGRQYVPVGAGLSHSFDGASASGSFFGGSVRAVLFGGARVSHFIEPDRDALFGGEVSVAPWRGALLEVSDIKYTHHLWEVGASQRICRDHRVEARFSSIDDDPESFRLSGRLLAPAGVSATLDYFRKIGSGEGRKAFPLDFTSLDDEALSRLRIGVLAPYARYSVRLRKPFGDRLALGLGGARRKLIHDEDEDEFNRSDWEAEGSADVRDVPFRGLSAYVHYRHIWEDRVLTADGSSGIVTGGLSYRFAPRLAAGLEVFANSIARTVAESIIPEGFAQIDREEKGGAVWAKWTGTRLSGEVRYEVTDDDLYDSYGAKAVHSATVAVSVNL